MIGPPISVKLKAHLVLLICGFVVGYSFKPILDTSRFDLIKNEFESREAILKEQLQCGKLRLGMF